MQSKTQPPAAVFPDPKNLLCAYCGESVKSSSERGQAVGLMFSTQVWCDNDDCPAYNVTGDVQITTLPGSKHRSRPPRKAAETAVVGGE